MDRDGALLVTDDDALLLTDDPLQGDTGHSSTHSSELFFCRVVARASRVGSWMKSA
jgi:hypothetical protein